MCMSEEQKRKKEEARAKSISDTAGIDATGRKSGETQKYDYPVGNDL